MPSSSGTFKFQSIEVELIIREAFENIGILGEFVESQKLESARRSINFLLLEWMSKSVNIWTLETAYLPLVTNQGQYILPNTVSDIIQANIRTTTRQLDGTPFSSDGGDAASAFDGDPATACTQDAANGYISYDYGDDVNRQITFVGITSQVTETYQILIETSADNATWSILQTLDSQIFTAGVNKWFDVIAPKDARVYRIRENGGATLNIQEIYFSDDITDIPLGCVSRTEYYNYPNQGIGSRPSVYYLHRTINPVLYLWQAPSSTYNCLQYSYKKMMQDAGAYTNALEIPSRLYPAMVLGLSWKLALKFNPQMAATFKGEYEQSFNIATVEDSEHTPLSIQGAPTYYGHYR